MADGSFTYEPQGSALAMDAIPIGVFLYDASRLPTDEEPEASPYTLIPNIRCEQIQYKEGNDPPTARFSYIMDEIAAASSGNPDDPDSPRWPTQFDQIWPLGVEPSPYIVANSDDLVVLATMPDDTRRVLFHGLARVPQTDVEPGGQHVNFVAVGMAIRAWEQPIGGRFQIDGDDPYAGRVIATDLPTRFNPAGTGTRAIGGILPNCTPAGFDIGQEGKTPYPVFLDSSIDRDPDPRTLWDLSSAVRYILYNWNITPNKDASAHVIDNPDFLALNDLLQDRRPLDGAQYFDPTDPATYQTALIIIRDYDATNKPWPIVLEELLGFYGFGMRWTTETGSNEEPVDSFEVYRKDASGPTDPKSVFLPVTGTDLAAEQVNLSAFHAGFDYHSVANDVFIESHLQRWEVSVILAPGFVPFEGDSAVAARTRFLLSKIRLPEATPNDRKAYRYYIADECGDGHYSIDEGEWIDDVAFDWSDIAEPEEDGTPTYVNRYRPGKGTLFSKDLDNKPRKATLSVSRDYGGQFGGADPPCLWDGRTGHWQDISPGSWNLLEDRLGIEITCEDVEAWNIGKAPKGLTPDGHTWPCPTGILRGIASVADSADALAGETKGQIWLRLTTVIELDVGIGTHAPRRDASPLTFAIQRAVDATDHYHYDVVSGTSAFFKVGNPDAIPRQAGPDYADIVQDDTDEAMAQATQLRSAHEFPPLTASFVIPMFDDSLQVGDRVSRINGRDVSLLTNSGSEQREKPSYPFVVAVTWDFQGDNQSTHVQLSDRRHEPRRAIA